MPIPRSVRRSHRWSGYNFQIRSMTLDRTRFHVLVDYLAAGVVVSLPWSTSATSILAALWLVAVALTLDAGDLRDVGVMLVAVLPVALAVLAFGGMLWADVGWSERLKDAEPFLKLLVIPLLLVQFRRTGRGEQVLTAFFASACVLLAFSWLLAVIPGFPWPAKYYGVPVKDYIIQSGVFTLCLFALLDRAAVMWSKSRARSMFLIGLAFIFIINILFIASARTTLVVIAVLFVLLGLRHFESRALAAFMAAVVALAVVAWSASPYLRFRVMHVVEELDSSRANEIESPAGARVQFWKMSLKIVHDAPFIGHGTGSTKALFAQIAGTDPMTPGAATNPHNQVLAVAIPLGLVGVVLLLAIWVAHFLMFIVPGHAAWIGLSVVTQNIVGSLFNSHLLDFAQGWLYVFGVGIAGGIILRTQECKGGMLRALPSQTAK
jgi:O-antigen ligase